MCTMAYLSWVGEGAGGAQLHGRDGSLVGGLVSNSEFLLVGLDLQRCINVARCLLQLAVKVEGVLWEFSWDESSLECIVEELTTA